VQEVFEVGCYTVRSTLGATCGGVHRVTCPWYVAVGSDMSERKPKMDEDKRKCLNLLEYISEKYPSLRVCQIIGNVVPDVDAYYTTDEELVGYMEEYI